MCCKLQRRHLNDVQHKYTETKNRKQKENSKCNRDYKNSKIDEVLAQKLHIMET
jgi:hypothetical protein